MGDALVNLTRPQAHQALSALSGEAYASTRTAMINESYYLRNALITRLDCVTNDVICNTQDAGYRQKGNPHALSVWGVTYGSVGGNAGGNGTSSMNQSSVGWIMGADTTLQHWRVGGMLAYGRSMFSDASAHNSSSHANNASIGLYGGRAWSVGGLTRDAALTLKLGLTYSWDMINTNRSIRLPDYQEKTHSNYRAGTAQAFGETGYRFTLHAHHTPIALEPFVRMTYLSTQYGSFHEHGSLAALRVKGRNDNMGYATFGLKSSTRFTLGAVAIAPHLSAAYRYGFGMTRTTAHAAFAAAGQDATMMSVAGTPISANTALLNTGLSAQLAQRLDVSVDYIGQYGSHITSSGGFGSATYRF
ncbi:outer membrane autotransporter barrel protein [Saccharibacter floricola DSM 15669]|uniref:Outer membrane autotransporter barrel protein n=1 Tax=Saccharibacter floricola DSM 15669 TaxID=1123227 RepID=A0ABQ0NZB6_9PROT|nr:outer membrane autotransporter barrel protein [Saccharibacter floricola DSM 15669]